MPRPITTTDRIKAELKGRLAELDAEQADRANERDRINAALDALDPRRKAAAKARAARSRKAAKA